MCDKTGEYWESFVQWAIKNGIEFRHPDDYEPWWRCWYNAIQSVTISKEQPNG